MQTSSTNHVHRNNHLLRGLSEATLDRLQPHFREREMEHKAVLMHPHTEVTDVYFPLSGVISWIVSMQDGDMAEAVTIGREGMAGVSAILGGSSGAAAGIVQAPGRAVVIARDALEVAADEDPALLKTLLRYANTLINVMAQGAACNRLHEVTERCARWLLMMHDRADGDEFTLLQEFLADMLGVRRPSVSVCASILQRAGLISYRRGRVRVENREGLEKASCECYGVIADEYSRMFAQLGAAR